MIQAASGIAMTSETLSLIPSENKSLSTGLWMTLYTGGTGLSGTLFSQLLKLGVFSNEWSWMGNPMGIWSGRTLDRDHCRLEPRRIFTQPSFSSSHPSFP